MAYTRITSTRYGASAIRYAFEEESHKEGMERVLMASGHNVLTEYAASHMKATWDAFGKNDGKSIQMYRLIQSFSFDELDPSNPDHIQMANDMGMELAMELYPDRQALIVTQADGEGGKLHNHILVNSVSAVTGKSLNEGRHWKHVSAKSDEIIRRYGLKPIEKQSRDKETLTERKLSSAGEYVWKGDLKARIALGMRHESVVDEQTFIQHMAEVHGVNVRYRGNDKDLADNDTKIKGVSYDFIDEGGKKRTSRAGKLGRDFQSAALQEQFDKNALQLVEEPVQPVVTAGTASGFDFDFEGELHKIRGKGPSKKLPQTQVQVPPPPAPKPKTVSDDLIGIDFGAELNRIRGVDRQALTPKETAIQETIRRETEQMKREAEEAERARQDAAYREELKRQAEEHARLLKEQALAEQRALEEQREMARQQELERQRKEQEVIHARARQLALQREDAVDRIRSVTLPYTVVTAEFADRFIAESNRVKGQTWINATGKRVPYTDRDIYYKVDYALAAEKRNRNNPQRSVVEVQHENVGPDR